jgi:hypothetical protein
MPTRRKKTQLPVAHEQPYDSSFKALLDDQTLALLSLFLEEEVISAHELKESIFKREMVKPALRVDCAYTIRSRKNEQGPINNEILHMEFETAPTLEIGERMSEYRMLPCRKHKQPIVQVLVCPFETPYLPMPPYRMQREDGELLLESRYKVVALWKCEVSELLTKGWVELYALLPAMKGATYEVLAQGIKAMRTFYAADEGRLCTHLLWFGTLLARTTTVSQEDKERTRREMNEFESLLDSNPFVRQRFAKGRAEGLTEGEAKGHAEGLTEGEAKGREEGLAEGLQEALVTAVELRFPTLLNLAQERARRVKEPAVLKFVLKSIKATPSEEMARTLLETLAA